MTLMLANGIEGSRCGWCTKAPVNPTGSVMEAFGLGPGCHRVPKMHVGKRTFPKPSTLVEASRPKFARRLL